MRRLSLNDQEFEVDPRAPDSDEPAVVVMFSNRINPGAVACPDSDKVAFWAGEGEWFTMVRPDEKIDHWTGEG